MSFVSEIPPPPVFKHPGYSTSQRKRTSARQRDVSIVLDEAARQRRVRQAIEFLNEDNHHDDPHEDLVINKNLPKFHEAFKVQVSKKKRAKIADNYKYKYNKTLGQMIKYEGECRPDRPHFMEAVVPPSKMPKRNFCPVCGFEAPYTCIKCGTRYCSVECLRVHYETRCLKRIM